MFKNNIDFDILRQHCQSESPKNFMNIDASAIIRDLCENYQIDTKFKDMLKMRKDILGYYDIVDKKYQRYCVVEDLNVNYSPKIMLYPLANGNSFQVKIKKAIFKKYPLKRGDIIKVVDSDHQYKMKKVDGEWVKSTTEKEWWINEYKVY